MLSKVCLNCDLHWIEKRRRCPWKFWRTRNLLWQTAFLQVPAGYPLSQLTGTCPQATPPPVQQQNEAQGENVYTYEDEILEEVTRTDPSPPNRITGNLRPQTSSSSSSINDNLEVNRSDPSPPNRITENLRRRTSLSSSVYNNFAIILQ